MAIRNLLFPQIPAISLLLVLAGCGSPESSSESTSAPPFLAEKVLFPTLKGIPLAKRSPRASESRLALLSPDSTGVSYVNVFQPDHPRKDLYSSGFTCGGVAIGDVNGDGWPDLFFTGGPSRNKLFRNLGGFRFEDVTRESGIAKGRNPWSAGAAFADFDGDGDLDLYVCNHETANQLWVNNGTGKFTEQAKKFGMDTVSSSLMPYFQDYDSDGDLDFFLLTN
ncbi:MAG: FG-GAP-like repeat-containing protein, partial [Opitutales bacterium]